MSVNASSASSFCASPEYLFKWSISYVTVAIGQYGTLLSVRNRRVSMLQSNPLWGPRRNLLVLVGMTGTVLICIVNLYGRGFQQVFNTRPIPGMYWGLPFTFALGILLMDEVRKAIVRKYPKVRVFLALSTLRLH
jgi:sodium/potassium-transporting ATPase subunit alpha